MVEVLEVELLVDEGVLPVEDCRGIHVGAGRIKQFILVVMACAQFLSAASPGLRRSEIHDERLTHTRRHHFVAYLAVRFATARVRNGLEGDSVGRCPRAREIRHLAEAVRGHEQGVVGSLSALNAVIEISCFSLRGSSSRHLHDELVVRHSRLHARVGPTEQVSLVEALMCAPQTVFTLPVVHGLLLHVVALGVDG